MTTSPHVCVARGVWSIAEHERFLEAVVRYPTGPWHLITAHVGTRSAKQVQTHAQKYQHKLLRHQRGLRKCKTQSKRCEHRVDSATIDWLLRPAGRTRGRLMRPPQPPQQRQEASTTPVEDSGSESSDGSVGSAALDTIEPIPFWSKAVSPLSEQERNDIQEALDVILSWSPPLFEFHSRLDPHTCVSRAAHSERLADAELDVSKHAHATTRFPPTLNWNAIRETDFETDAACRRSSRKARRCTCTAIGARDDRVLKPEMDVHMLKLMLNEEMTVIDDTGD